MRLNQWGKLTVCLSVGRKMLLFRPATSRFAILGNREVAGCVLSGWRDLNPRPLGPEPSALAGLSHTPNKLKYYKARRGFSQGYVMKTRSAAEDWAAVVGSRKEKRLPLPSTLSTQMRPPWISIMSLAMERPRPMPPWRRVRCFSTW
jgi:hypothetical protein